MKTVIIGVLVLGTAAAAGYFYPKMQASAVPGERYTRSDVYAQCDRDYLQSAPHLGFRAQKSDCECFDKALQKLSPRQSKAAYKSLEDQLTLAFMGKAGAKVSGNNVTLNDDVFGEVNANVRVETSGKVIMAQCKMF